MMKSKRSIYFLLTLFVIVFYGSDSCAQNIFKLDFWKTPGKFGTQVQKQSENYEAAVKEIAETQQSSCIGDGIKSAKDGFKAAKEKMKEIKNVMKTVKDKISAVKNSAVYKGSLISAKIATETVVLDKMKKDRDAAKSVVESDAEIKRVAMEEKVKIAKQNYAVSFEIFQNEFTELKDEKAKDAKRLEIEEFKNEYDLNIKALSNEISDIQEQTKAEIKNIDTSFALSIAAQTQMIAELGVELAELIGENAKKKKEEEEDPEEVIENAIDDFSYREGEVLTLDTRSKKEIKRNRRKEQVATEASGLSADIISTAEDEFVDEAQNSATSSTMNGKSEALQTAISQTAVQMENIYKYLMIELKSIEMEAANIMAGNKEYVAGEVKSSIDICNYKIDEKSFLNAIKDAKKAAKKVKNAVDKGKDAVNTAKGAVETIKNVNTEDMITGLTGM